MDDSSSILIQISTLKDMLDKVNDEIEANIQITRQIESEIVKCEEIEAALAARESEGDRFSIAEKMNYLVFMINAFQSLEDEVVSETVLRLASLQCWHSLSFGRFQVYRPWCPTCEIITNQVEKLANRFKGLDS